jgi:dipeptidyl aminopeptidase/acylaminoacyl peptidase
MVAPVAVRTIPIADLGLVPRRTFAANPDHAAVTISPDGKRLAFLAPADGVMNLWVAPVESPEAATQLTRERDRSIRSYTWAEDDRHLLFLVDRTGDEDPHLFAVDLLHPDAEARDLTPFPGARAELVGLSPRKRGHAAVAINDRDPRRFDLYLVELATGRRTLLEKNEAGHAGYVVDRGLAAVLALAPRADGGLDVLRKQKKGFAPWLTIPAEDAAGFRALGVDERGRTAYFLDSRGRDTLGVVAVALASKKPEAKVIFEDGRADVKDVLFHPASGLAQAATVDYDRLEWHALDAKLAPDLQRLHGAFSGAISVTSRSRDDQRWVVVNAGDDASPRSYLYTPNDKRLLPLFVHQRALDAIPLAKMFPRVIEARDGLELMSYLSLPPGSDDDQDGRPSAPLPLVLVVHGGPWARDAWGMSPTHQWLASRGYAVLSVNYRGSAGFGKKFLDAGNGEWGGKMQDDLLDAVRWAVGARIADPAKVALHGASYGGYATLMGLASSPETFACGVDVVGPSNLVTLLENLPPHAAPTVEQLVTRLGGDHRTEAGRTFLASRSPMHRAAELTRPLLIAQGANDPRVKAAESEQLVSTLRARGQPVTYALFADEGHGLARPENRLAFAAVAEIFLAQCLGGKYLPIGEDLAGSSLQVPIGAGEIHALEEALPGRAEVLPAATRAP